MSGVNNSNNNFNNNNTTVNSNANNSNKPNTNNPNWNNNSSNNANNNNNNNNNSNNNNSGRNTPSGRDSPTFEPWHQHACAEATINKNSAKSIKGHGVGLGAGSAAAVLAKSGLIWPNGSVLTYGFFRSNPGNTIQQAKVKEVVREWEVYANIKFKYVQGDNADIRITFNPALGSWSYVGREILGINQNEPTMNLGWLNDRSEKIEENERGVILHEFGHTLGLMHEHQSPVRDKKITLKEKAVVEYYMASQTGWTEEDVYSQIINVYNKDEVSNFSELDTESIMMYFMPAEMNNENVEIKPNNKLSDIDKAYAILNYPFPEDAPAPENGKWTFDYAIGVAGVDGDSKTKMLQYYELADWANVRYYFSNFCLTTRLTRKLHGIDPSQKEDDSLYEWCGSQELQTGPSGAARGVTIQDKLWTPGERVTYSFIQGTLDATTYRRRRVQETFKFWMQVANLKIEEIPWDPQVNAADIHIWFGDIPPAAKASAWSLIGTSHRGGSLTDDQRKIWGGVSPSTVVFSDAVPKEEPTDASKKKWEERVLYHEFGHVLGLLHEHQSPHTMTTDKPDGKADLATPWDEKSVMLYPNRELRSTTFWESISDYFNPRSTKFNAAPSAYDTAFVGALYPYDEDHVDDHFEKDIKTLGLTSSLTTLSDLRKNAFKYAGRPEFAVEIRKLRQEINKALNALVNSNRKYASAQPAHGVDPSRTVTTPPAKLRGIMAPETASTAPFLKTLLEKLNDLFNPSTGQMFALQFPGRFLQEDQYAWDTEGAGYYGPFVKPAVVNESEFRLVDQLYNVGQIIGAPNGRNLSLVYEQCLNNLAPGFDESIINMSKHQNKIRTWLLREVPVTPWIKDLIKSQHDAQAAAAASNAARGAARAIEPTPSTTSSSASANSASSSISLSKDSKPQFAVANKLSKDETITRIELADALNQEYLTAKNAWEEYRDKLIREAKPEDLDHVTRLIAHLTPVREAQLSSKHADYVVRGHSHLVRQYLGYLDIKTPAEFLQEAKDALRESATSSLDGAMKVYPVQLNPIDWFKGLSTSFTMEDLTSNKDLILDQIDAKSRQMDLLNVRLAVIQKTPKANIEKLEKDLEAAQIAYDKAQADLSSTYTNNVISLAMTCIDESNKFDLAAFETSAKAKNIAKAAIANIKDGMDKLTSAQTTLTQASRSYTRLLSAKSLAESTDTTQEVVQINGQLTSLTRDIEELQSRLKALKTDGTASATPTTPTSIKDIPVIPPETATSGGSRWQEIVMSHEMETTWSEENSAARADASKTSVNLFFASYNSESSSSSSSATAFGGSQKTKVDIGFRTTLVTVDRGGWFQPSFFSQANAFHHINDKVSWAKWPEDINSVQQLKTATPEQWEEVNRNSLLPAYPTGFVICKDITIKIASSVASEAKAASAMENMTAKSGGVLVWSFSESHHDQASSKSHSFKAYSDGYIIKIPGPQILGYIMQYTDPDTTSEIPKTLPVDFLLSDEEYDKALKEGPQNSANPPPARAAETPSSGGVVTRTEAPVTKTEEIPVNRPRILS